MIGIIYKYISPSNKVYIWQTIHEHTRYMRHKHITDEHKRKISEAQKGKKVTVETKQKMSIASKNRQRDSKGHFIKNN